MCCVITALLFFGPRLAIFIWYLINPVYVNPAFSSFIWACLGWVFLPWTTLVYIAIYPGGITGLDWLLLVIGVLIDLGSYGGGGYSNRHRIPGYSG